MKRTRLEIAEQKKKAQEIRDKDIREFWQKHYDAHEIKEMERAYGMAIFEELKSTETDY